MTDESVIENDGPDNAAKKLPEGQKNGEDGIKGERSIFSLGRGKKLKKSGPKHRAVIFGSILGAGLLLWASLDGAENKAEPEEPTQNQTTRIGAGKSYEAAEVQKPAQETEQSETPAEDTSGTSPIERARGTAVQGEVSGQSDAELLFETSKRSPVLAFTGDLPNEAPGETADVFGEPAPQGASDAIPLSGVADKLRVSRLEGSKASLLKDPHLTITQGTTIPCTLDNALDSTLPGLTRCTVNADVYGTTGAVVLLEKGSRVVGQYEGELQRGRARLFIAWTRAETPNGVVINLDSPATDALGRTGVAGDIDTQFWTRFGGTMMLSIIDDALIIAAQKEGQGSFSYGENTAKGVENIAQTELESTINVPVILRKNQGEQVSIMVARDLDFTGVYRLSGN